MRLQKGPVPGDQKLDSNTGIKIQKLSVKVCSLHWPNAKETSRLKLLILAAGRQ